MSLPTVTVLIPTYMEARHLDATLASIEAQDYSGIVQVLVVDGGSTDGTPEIARSRGATVLQNPRRIQAAALNVGLASASGEVIVRVDGHCLLESDYVSCCIDALEKTGAAMVGGAMRPVAEGWLQEGIAAAMSSPFGAGPARFHTGGDAGWVDTVYLGSFRRDDALTVGGYAEDVGVNEDAEFAIRMGHRGGVWFDPAIRSSYEPRSDLLAVARQFWRYGLSRAATARRHPRSVSPRQLAAPGLVVGLLSPWRRLTALTYLLVVLMPGVAWSARRRGWRVGLTAGVVTPTMHLSWGTGFLLGLLNLRRPPQPTGGHHLGEVR